MVSWIHCFLRSFFQVLLRQGQYFLLFSFFECLAGYMFSPAFNKLKTRDFQYTFFHLIFTFLNFKNTLKLELELEQFIFYRIKSCVNTQPHNNYKFLILYPVNVKHVQLDYFWVFNHTNQLSLNKQSKSCRYGFFKTGWVERMSSLKLSS